jgi:hypothetical protein
MKLKTLIAASALALATPAHAAIVTVANVGSILNESLSLPAQKTPGLGAAFEYFFEFSLPVGETVTLSMTDSATGAQRITGGLIELNHWTSSSPLPPHAPLGALIESAPIVDFIGGQGATVTPDALKAGAYFAEVSGISGGSPLRIAVDSTITATVPELSTWAMMGLGFAMIAWVGLNRKRAPHALV